MHVVIADDKPQPRQYAHQILRSVGHTIDGIATTGEQAVEMVRLYRPDIVILDITMPGKGGIWAARTIREEGLAPHIIIASSNVQKQYVDQVQAIRGVGMIGKPFVRNTMLNELARIIPGFAVAVAVPHGT